MSILCIPLCFNLITLIVLQAVNLLEDTKEVRFQGVAYPRPIEHNHILPPLAWVTPFHPNAFIHEVGHLFGCNHTIEQHSRESGQLTNNSNHGYYLEGTNMATIMAYPTETHDLWIPHFSSKDKALGGVPLGDDRHDNRNQIMKTRFLVSQYGDESGSCNNPR